MREHQGRQAAARPKRGGRGYPVRVIDFYSVKPLDVAALWGAAAAASGQLVVASTIINRAASALPCRRR